MVKLVSDVSTIKFYCNLVYAFKVKNFRHCRLLIILCRRVSDTSVPNPYGTVTF